MASAEDGWSAKRVCFEPMYIRDSGFHWPIFDERIYAMLIGNLADGPLWVWGPHGPVPVDPWGPKVADKARAARESIVKGLEVLHDLGRKLEQSRAKVAEAQPLAPDDDVEQEAQDKALGVSGRARKKAKGAGDAKGPRRR